MRQVYINDGRVSDYATCDQCGVEQHPDEMLRVVRRGWADSYLCTSCVQRDEEQRGDANGGGGNF